MLAPELQQLINEFKSLNINYTQMPAADARRLAHELSAKRPRMPDVPPTQITLQKIALPGRDINLRIYKPAVLAEKITPVIVYFHGGGFVWGRPEFYDDMSAILADASQATIISVDYRYAPEFPFPAGFNDCYETLEYVQQHATQFNINADKISVAGDSAGGNLAAAVCLKARDEQGPKIQAQLLIFPCLEINFDRNSYRTMGQNYLLTTELMHWFYDQYLANADDKKNPLAMPLNAKDFSNLPPALIIAAQYDPLCDEDEEYAARLKTAGNRVDYVCYSSLIHGFITLGMVCPAAKTAVEDMAAKFSQLLRAE